MGALEEAKEAKQLAWQAVGTNDWAEVTAYATFGVLALMVDAAEREAAEDAAYEARFQERTDRLRPEYQDGEQRCHQSVDGARCLYYGNHDLPHRAWGPEGEFVWPADPEEDDLTRVEPNPFAGMTFGDAPMVKHRVQDGEPL